MKIKEEFVDAAPHIKIEPERKRLLITEKGFIEANYSIDDIDIKEEPLQNDLVSVYYHNVLQFMLHELLTKFFLCLISHAVQG